MSSPLVCPILTANGPVKTCIEAECMLFVKGSTSSTCAFVKLPRKTVIRLDAISAQLQEMQILLNQIENQMLSADGGEQ